MMKLGLRASPTEVTYCIIDENAEKVVTIGEITVPLALNTPEQLKHIKLNLLDIIREYEIVKAGIRILEPTSQRIPIERVQIEGVIQEAFASSNLKSYYIGQISSISSRVKIPRTDFKKFIEGEKEFDRVENWEDLGAKQREATLCAMGA